MKKLVLGLDIGITSVGWAVINKDKGEVVDCGVRIFNEGDPSLNVDRRSKRSLRRNVSRRSNRRKDAIKYLKEIGVEKDASITESPYILRKKGLTQELTDGEFYRVFMHLVKRRGSSLESIEDETATDESLKGMLSTYDQRIKDGMFPCEIQIERMENGEAIRGIQNNFRTIHYYKELSQILTNQRFDAETQEELCSFITRRRRFDEGPGSMKSPSDYGRFIQQEDGSIKVINLIEKMTGKCSIYPDEIRAPKLSPSAELFNLLNDFNNLSFIESDRKLTSEEKLNIINQHIFYGKHKITARELCKALDVNIDKVRGFRVDTKDKPLLTDTLSIRSFLKIIKNQDNIWNIIHDLDSISVILTRNKNLEERVQEIKDLNLSYLSDEHISEIAKLKNFQGYHSLSFKIMREMREPMISTSNNYMQLLKEAGKLNPITSESVVSKNIEFDGSLVYSPVARRSINQAIKMVNRARELFGEFDAIVIEMPRDKNSAEEKKRIRDFQKYRETQSKKIKELVSEDKLNGALRTKLLLYLEQECKCLYTGETIQLDTLISDPYAYEIDHIIPISVSFDDSLSNKALVTRLANQEKEKRTVVETFKQNKFSKGWGYEAFHNNAIALYTARKITKSKFFNLMFDEPLDSIDTLKRFVNRNLVDTQYSSRVVLNTLQDYFKLNKIDTSILTVRGAVTSQFRKQIKLNKDRDEDFSHHAIDAAIVAMLSEKKKFYSILKHSKINNDEVEVDNTVKVDTFDDYYDESIMRSISSVKEIENVKISHKVDRKPNRKVSDDTIYSTRLNDGVEYVVKKYKDIYGPEGIKIAQRIESDDKLDMFLMHQHDPETFAYLVRIVEDYLKDNKKIEKENPFLIYRDQFGPIRKVSKSGNGPVIKSMKYRDSKLGNHIDITENYTTSTKEGKQRKVVLQQISPFRTDFYKRDDGSISFVTIRYKDIRFDENIKKYCIDSDLYHQKLVEKKLDNATFMHSFNRGDIIKITSQGKESIEEEMYRFIGTNDDNSNKIEVKLVHTHKSKRMLPSIGRSILNIEKYSTDILGNLYQIPHSNLNLIL